MGNRAFWTETRVTSLVNRSLQIQFPLLTRQTCGLFLLEILLQLYKVIKTFIVTIKFYFIDVKYIWYIITSNSIIIFEIKNKMRLSRTFYIKISLKKFVSKRNISILKIYLYLT